MDVRAEENGKKFAFESFETLKALKLSCVIYVVMGAVWFLVLNFKKSFQAS